MAAEHRIQGLFSDGEAPRASEDESGLRERPRPPRQRRESLPDLSGLAVELPDEDDLFEDLPDSDTIPPTRGFRAALVEERVRASSVGRSPSEPPPPPRASRSEPPPLPRRKGGEPPPLPVELTRRRPPALPLLLTRQTVPPDAGRISFGDIARTAQAAPSVRPGAMSDAVRLRREMVARERRRRVVRRASAVGALAACFAIGFGLMALAQGSGDEPATLAAVTAETPEASASPVERGAPGAVETASAAAERSTAVEAPSGAVRLDEVRVEGSSRLERARSTPAARPRAASPEPETAARPRRSTAEPETAASAPSGDTAAAPDRGEGRAAQTSEADEPALPATPPRAEVLAAIRSVEGEVRACAEGVEHHGVAPVRITVAPSGRVTTAVVQGGGLVGTPAGSCIARAVRAARFPAFTQDSFAVDYPFTL